MWGEKKSFTERVNATFTIDWIPPAYDIAWRASQAIWYNTKFIIFAEMINATNQSSAIDKL